MKKEANYIVTVHNRNGLTIDRIIANLESKGDIRKRTVKLEEIRENFRIFNSNTPVPESQLAILKKYAEDGGFELDIQRIKRAYVRRKPIVSEEKKEIEEDRFGCFVGLNTVVNVYPHRPLESRPDQYRIHRLARNIVVIQHVNGNSATSTYSTAQFNDYLNTRHFRVVNTTPEIEARIGVFNNVVTKDKFSRTTTNFSNVYTFIIKKNGSGGTVQVGPGFTSNCQLTVVGQMATLIASSSNIKAQLLEIYKIDNRRLLLCDINYQYLAKLQAAVDKDAFTSVQEYKSSNGSRMVICILNLTKL